MSGERIHLSLDDETAAILEEMEEHIQESYGGISAFFRTMVRDYSDDEMAKAHIKSIKRKINKKESELDFLHKELETWKSQLEEEKKEQKQEEILETVEQLKAEKSKIQGEIKSEEEIRQKAKKKYKDKDHYFDSEEEKQEKIDEFVERRMGWNQDKRDRIEEINEKVEKLMNQEEVEA